MGRRMGVENAPHVFNKNFRTSAYSAIPVNKLSVKIINLFEWIGTNTAENSVEDFRNKNLILKKFLNGFGQAIGNQKNFYYGLGGGPQILDEFVQNFGFDSEKNVLIKISPRIGGGKIGEDQSAITNENYLTHFRSSNSGANAKVYQLGLQGPLCHAEELEHSKTAKNECFWLDAIIRDIDISKSNCKTQFGHFVNVLLQKIEKQGKKALILFDCEAIEAQFMVGVGCPSVNGITKDEFTEMMEIFGKRIHSLTGLLTINYNPTVEAKRSAEMLIYGLYKMLNFVHV